MPMPAVRPTAPQLAVLDDDVEVARFTREAVAPGGQLIAESSLRIGGMHCAGCADLVERALRRDPGVVEVHVSAAAHLVRLEKVGAENPLRFFSDEDVMAFALPVFQRIAPAHVSREGIGLSCADHRLQDGPDRVAIVGSRASNHRHGSLCRMGSIRGSTDTYSSKVARNVTGAEGRRRHAR